MIKSYCYNGFGICYYGGKWCVYGVDKSTMKYGHLRNFETEEEAKEFIDNLIERR